MTETWRPAPGYEKSYSVSSLGRVRRDTGGRGATAGRVLSTPQVAYVRVTLHQGNQGSQRLVHRLVCSAFNGPAPADKPLALHRNGDASDNRAENLYWGDVPDNQQDAVRHGTHANTRKTHCPQGHEYSETNTYVYPDGRRRCRSCKRRRR